jgi:outer membrane protein
VAFAAAGVLALLAPRVYAQLRVAVVDTQRALLETDQGRHAKTQLKTLFQKRQVDLDARQSALKRMRDDIEAQKSTMDRATLQRRMEEYQKQFVDFEQNFLQYQQELAQREAELTKQIYVNLEGVIRQLGQQENLTAIFDQSGVVWAPQHLDLTDRVVQAYNRQFPAREEPAPAPEAPRADDAGTAPPRPAATPAPAPAPARPRPNPHPRGEGQPPAQ